jgi:chromosome segregation ATPase
MPRAHQEVSAPEELRAKLATMEGKLRWTQERLNAQKEWLDGVETQYQDLMARFQDAKSDEDRSSTLEQLGRITEDRNHARSELRGTEQAFEHLELEIKAATTRLERLSAPS